MYRFKLMNIIRFCILSDIAEIIICIYKILYLLKILNTAPAPRREHWNGKYNNHVAVFFFFFKSCSNRLLFGRVK